MRPHKSGEESGLVFPLNDSSLADVAPPELRHAFVGRVPGVNVATTDRERAIRLLKPSYNAAAMYLGFLQTQMVWAEQVHGTRIACITKPTPDPVPGVDGLATGQPGLLLGILVADCCPVYVVDPRARAIALLHAGRRGAEGGILPNTIAYLGKTFGSRTRDLHIVCGPCIHPEDFEMDIPRCLEAQAIRAEVPAGNISLSPETTSRNLNRYYSYRMEKGKTGRMLALLGFASI